MIGSKIIFGLNNAGYSELTFGLNTVTLSVENTTSTDYGTLCTVCPLKRNYLELSSKFMENGQEKRREKA